MEALKPVGEDAMEYPIIFYACADINFPYVVIVGRMTSAHQGSKAAVF